MKIYYDSKENGLCLTPCPAELTGINDGRIMVGSMACDKCKHHFNSKEPNTILCNFKLKKNRRQ